MLKVRIITCLLFAIVFISCDKPEVRTPGTISYRPPPPPPPSTPTLPCTNRSYINATLIPVSTFSLGRIDAKIATVGNKILFGGGWTPYATGIVEIYDISTNTWSMHSLTDDWRRVEMAVVTAGNKVFFAGGSDGIGEFLSRAVDIYDATTNTWSTTQLSAGRAGLAAAVAGNKVYFAGGWEYTGGATLDYSNLVDIYDLTTNQWTTGGLSQGRADLSATTAGDKIYFAGGRNGNGVSNRIDILDITNNSWSTSTLQEPKALMASIVKDNKIYWAGGGKQFTGGTWVTSNLVEIQDLNSGNTTTDCITPKMEFAAVKKNEYIVFFTGTLYTETGTGTQFEIYNTITNQWLIGILPQQLNNAAVIAVNNTIYVAGGTNSSWIPFDKLWKLEF